LKRHNKQKKSIKCLYDSWKAESIQSKEFCFYIIHDKMDHSMISLQMLQVKKKLFARLSQLPITLIGITAHGHGDEAFT
jgi:hypothetical protein